MPHGTTRQPDEPSPVSPQPGAREADAGDRRPDALPDGVTLDGDVLEVSMGPQHPSTHGVFRMNVVLDGETVVKLKPVFGYLHRNHEKIAEGTTYLSSMPYTDRLD